MSDAPNDERLVEALFGELARDEQQQLEYALSQSGELRQRWNELRQTQQLLATVPDRSAHVSLAAIYSSALRGSARTTGRYRLAAIGAIAAALLLGVLFAAGIRLEWQPKQLVLRWGAAPVADAAPAAANPTLEDMRRSARQEQRLAALEEVCRLLLNEVDRTDRRSDRMATAIERECRGLREEADARWQELRRDVQALYVLQNDLIDAKKGE